MSQDVEIIIEYLKSFSADGSGDMRQDCPVEPEVLKALAKRLHSFAFSKDKGTTLDAAFGGNTKRQLQKIRSDEKAFEVTFEIACAKRCKNLTHIQAVDEVAKKLSMSSDSVRDDYKRAGPKGQRQRGGKSKKIHPD